MPLARVWPLPLISHCDKVVVGRNTPVLPSLELVPTREVPSRTPDVNSDPDGTSASVNQLGTLLAVTVRVAGQ